MSSHRGRVGLSLLACALVAACSTSPSTGRVSVKEIPDAINQLFSEFDHAVDDVNNSINQSLD